MWPTVEYLMNEMRCGIYVRIQGGELSMFVPFVNHEYENRWDWGVDVDSYQSQKESALGYRENLLPTEKWWLNSYIVCNVQNDNFWGDGNLPQLRHMLGSLCSSRSVPDTEFFINKRDLPQLREDGVHPHGFLFGDFSRIVDPAGILPIFSGYTGDGFVDRPFPLPADWERANEGLYFCGGGGADPLTSTRWASRSSVAMWRGGATGGGTTVEDNQRLHLVTLTQGWDDVDAKLTSWNTRDKKLPDAPVRFVNPADHAFEASRDHFLTPRQQSKFKYAIYVDGHSAANRYSTLMASGFVILRVKSISTLSNQLWFFDKLVLGEDHLEVEADLSNLREVLDWCKSHDDECKAIAKRARTLWSQELNREAILDFVERSLSS